MEVKRCSGQPELMKEVVTVEKLLPAYPSSLPMLRVLLLLPMLPSSMLLSLMPPLRLYPKKMDPKFVEVEKYYGYGVLHYEHDLP